MHDLQLHTWIRDTFSEILVGPGWRHSEQLLADDAFVRYQDQLNLDQYTDTDTDQLPTIERTATGSYIIRTVLIDEFLANSLVEYEVDIEKHGEGQFGIREDSAVRCRISPARSYRSLSTRQLMIPARTIHRVAHNHCSGISIMFGAKPILQIEGLDLETQFMNFVKRKVRNEEIFENTDHMRPTPEQLIEIAPSITHADIEALFCHTWTDDQGREWSTRLDDAARAVHRAESMPLLQKEQFLYDAKMESTITVNGSILCDGEIAGEWCRILELFDTGHWHPHIRHQFLEINKSFRNQGVATKWMKRCLDAYTQRGIPHVHLFAADDGPWVWTKRGFVPDNLLPSFIDTIAHEWEHMRVTHSSDSQSMTSANHALAKQENLLKSIQNSGGIDKAWTEFVSCIHDDWLIANSQSMTNVNHPLSDVGIEMIAAVDHVLERSFQPDDIWYERDLEQYLYAAHAHERYRLQQHLESRDMMTVDNDLYL